MPVFDQIPNHDIPPAAGGGDGGAADAARAGAAPVLQVPPPPGLHKGEHQAGAQYQGRLIVIGFLSDHPAVYINPWTQEQPAGGGGGRGSVFSIKDV